MEDNHINKQKSWLDRKLDNLHGFWGSIVGPFLICFKHVSEFFIWALFVLVAGQLGTIINIVNRCIFQGWKFSEALYPDSSTGNFYTYALVLIASLIAPLFTRIKNDERPMFSTISMVFSSILIFAMILCAVFFSNVSQTIPALDYQSFRGLDLGFDAKQFIFFVLAVVFAWYAYGFSLMVKNQELLQLDDSYAKRQDERVKNVAKLATETTTDGKGTNL